MACLREGVSSIIIHVLTLCCIVVSVCHQTATDGDGFNPTAMPASGMTGKPFPSRTEHFNTNEDSGRLEVSIDSEEGREEEGSEKGRVDILWTKHWWLGERRRRRRMAGLDDERKLFTGHVPNITLIEITDDNIMEDGSENVTAESGRDAEELNTTKSVRDAEERADCLVGCNYAGLQEDSVMDKESDGRTNSHDTSTGKYRYAQFEDDELTTTQSTQVGLIREKSIENNIDGSTSTLHMLIMTHLPRECRTSKWNESSLWETVFDDLTGIQTHWLRHYNYSCYDKLNSCRGVESFSKTIELSPTDSLIVISPSCVPSSGLFIHQVYQDLFIDSLPESCSRSICENVIWLDIIRLPLIYMDLSTSPKSNSNHNLLIKDCYKKLLDMSTNSMSISEIFPQEEVKSITRDVSENSKCDSVIMVKVMNGRRNVVLVVSEPGCSSTFDVWFSSQTTKLFTCLKGKALKANLKTNIYNDFFEDFVDKDMRLFKLPSSCINLLCNDHVDLAVVTLSRIEKVKLWLPYVKYCSGQLCQSLLSTFIDCFTDLGVKRHLSFTPHSNLGRSVFSVSPQCLKNSLDAKQVKLKAEIIGRIIRDNNYITQDCLKVICDDSVLEEGNSTAFIFVEKFKAEYLPDTCLYKPHETININDYLTLVSYHLNNTNFILVYVYLVYYNHEKEKFREFIAELYNANGLNMITCCNTNQYRLIKYTTDGKVFYNCMANTSPPIPPHCDKNESHPWYTKKVGNNTSNTYIVILKEGKYLEDDLYLWLRTLDTDFSNDSLKYLFPPLDNRQFIYGRNEIIRFTEKLRTSVGFQSFISDIQRTNVVCDQSMEFTVCYKRGTKFPITQPNPRYLIIFHECVINPYLGEDQLILALLSHFHDTGITKEELCDKEHLSIVITTADKVEYETLGFPNEVVPVMNELKSSSPEWTWVETNYYDPWFVAHWLCLRLWEISHISYMLNTGVDCLYYTTSSVKVFMFIIHNHTSHVALYPLRSSSTLATPNLTGKYQTKSLVLQEGNGNTSHTLHIMKAGFNPFEGMYMYDYEEYPERVLNLQRELLKINYHAYVTGNEKCYNDIHNKKFFKVQNTNVQAIGPIPSNAAESSCFSSLPRTTKNAMLFYPERDDLVKVTINKFWPTCLYNMMVMTYKENATYVTDWWYLNPSCKRNEILLLVSSIVVTVITLAGNIFVLSVMITSGLLHDTTFMIRASLASADLLMGLIPAALAVYDQFGLMNGRLTLQNLNEDILLTNIPYIIASQSQGFQQLRFQRNGLMPILACFSFNVSTMVSLLTLAILSLERLCVMRGRPLPRTFMVKSIILSWTAGLLLSFLVNWRKEGIYFTGYFDPITKLTLNIGANAPSVSRWVFYLELCVMGLAGTIVIVCGTATLILFVFHHRLTSAVLSIHSCNRDSELRRTTIVFVLMVVMFTVTVGLVLVDICADLAVTKPLAHWLFWWGFVAASSWNWALYTLSGGRFREQIRSSLSCRRIQCLQKQSPSSPPPHCTQQQQHISLGSNMFGVMFGREKALQVELKSFSNTLKDININE